MRIGPTILICGIILLGIVLINPGVAAAATDPVMIAAAPKPTEPVMTQPLPPAVELGANLPLVCGGIVLLFIIIGGVLWNIHLKKSAKADH